jgi:hypothetical protein
LVGQVREGVSDAGYQFHSHQSYLDFYLFALPNGQLIGQIKIAAGAIYSLSC